MPEEGERIHDDSQDYPLTGRLVPCLKRVMTKIRLSLRIACGRFDSTCYCMTLNHSGRALPTGVRGGPLPRLRMPDCERKIIQNQFRDQPERRFAYPDVEARAFCEGGLDSHRGWLR